MSASLPLPDDFSNDVRLFPLPGVVLFPGNVMPLHIFESRYCEMLEDALMMDRIITIATLQPGYSESEYFSRPPIADITCVGLVTNCEKSDSGTYNLLLAGLKRALIEEELTPKRSFREARVRPVYDEPFDTSQSEKLAHSLVDRVKRQLPSSVDALDQLLEQDLTLSTLTDVLAFHLQFEVPFKLSLLSELNPLVRAQMMLNELPGPDASDADKAPPFSMN